MFEIDSIRYARPPDWSADVACRVEWTRRFGSTLAAKIVADPRGRHRAGWAFWTPEGRFDRWGDRAWSDLVPLGDHELLASRYPRTVERVGWPSLAVEDTLAFALPQSGIEELVVSTTRRLALACLSSGQGQGGYELFEVAPLRRVAGAPGFTLPVMPWPPRFTPDESRVVCVVGARTTGYNWQYNSQWWQSPATRDTDGEDAGAPGGPMPFARIYVHDLATATITQHRVDANLSEGWIPPDPELLEWSIPELVDLADDQLVLAVPGRRLSLPLPLPEAVTITL